MNSYKENDKFICINNEHTRGGGNYTVGKVYTLKKYFANANILILGYDDDSMYGWSPETPKEFNLMFKPYNPIIITKEEDYYKWLANRNKS